MKTKSASIGCDGIVRRQFCEMGALVSALIAAGHLPLVAARQTGKAAAQPDMPYAVRDYQAGVSGYQPPKTSTPAETRAYLFRRMNWPVRPGGDSMLAVSRKRDRNAVIHEMRERISAQGESSMTISTRSLDVRNGIASWKMSNSIDNTCGLPSNKLTIEESGEVSAQSITVRRGGWKETISHANPVYALWQLIDVIPEIIGKERALTIDLLDDGSLLLPGLTLAFDKAAAVPTAGGEINLQSYVLYGFGTLPMHFLYDAFGIPHLATFFMRMYALSGVS